MAQEWLDFDRITKSIGNIIQNCADELGVEIISVVLYGSRARGDRNSQNDYEILVLVSNQTGMKEYLTFNNRVMLDILKEKLMRVKITVYNPDVFEDILYNDKVLGTLLYMICRENIILYDKFSTFTAIKESIAKSEIKSEEKFLEQCIEFAKLLGSEKWERKWEKKLIQFQYLKKRRNFI